MDNQEFFDKATSGFLKQGVLSVDKTGECVYRCDDGRRCAVGFVVPDELYRFEFEGHAIETLIAEREDVEAFFSKVTALFAVEIQRCHDSIDISRDPMETDAELSLRVLQAFIRNVRGVNMPNNVDTENFETLAAEQIKLANEKIREERKENS